MIIGFNHTSFTVPDLEKAVRFWTDELGFEGQGIVERRGAWVAKVTGVPDARIRVAHLHGHGHHMEFIEYAEGGRDNPADLPDKPGVGHVCLDVEDMDDTFRRLIAAGATVLGEMTSIRDPAMAACTAGYLRDPNGIIIELFERG
ncbi:VOC family protein [Mesorhizobium sp. AR07]|uniref:VOC family protein n=1 Tax=Mesorhizobium sp. AR07 TaxID=2865838 RepID=UPI00215EA1A5|nr:VOC family protein [Mesorhizobium sp. AR07]UVK43878.1 VOC family protein [Mesorhizobium sp. AR07]